MARETEALLKSILYSLKLADNLESAISAVEVMCNKDEIATVEKAVAEERERRKNIAKTNNL